jgi:uncharacterized membrane protein
MSAHMLVLRRSGLAGRWRRRGSIAPMTGLTMGTEAWIWMGAWALVMVLVVWLLVREPHRASSDEPGTILADRFARGELSEEEYRRAIAALDADSPLDAPGGVHRRSTHHEHQGQEARHD